MRTYNQPDVFELTERLVRLDSEQNALLAYRPMTLRYEQSAPHCVDAAVALQLSQTVQSLYEAAFAA